MLHTHPHSKEKAKMPINMCSCVVKVMVSLYFGLRSVLVFCLSFDAFKYSEDIGVASILLCTHRSRIQTRRRLLESCSHSYFK